MDNRRHTAHASTKRQQQCSAHLSTHRPERAGCSYEYRVVETDIDGATTTSNVVQISITGGKQVYPNPANTLLNVKLPAGANSVPYRLISADGKIVLKGTVTNTGNYGQISVAGVASDIYFLQITVNNTLQTYEVRIQH